jgi:DNA-binding response OmpR family regulator
MLLEGDNVLRDVLSEILEDAGFSVIAVQSLSDAIAVARGLRLTVAIVEAWDLTGDALTDHGRASISQLAALAPTILLTTDPLTREIVPAELSLVCALPQPVNLDEFDAVLRDCIARKTADAVQPTRSTPYSAVG